MSNHRKPFLKTAWITIITLVVAIAYLQTLKIEEDSGLSDDAAEMVVVQLQAEYLLGVGALMGEEQNIATTAGMLDVGSVGQRLRYMAFMIGLGKTDRVSDAIIKMQYDLKASGKKLTETEHLYVENIGFLASSGGLPDNPKPFLDSLGWFGTFAVADKSEHDAMVQSAKQKVILIGVVFAIVCVLGVLGFFALLFCFIRALTGKLHSSMLPPNVRHGVYAEVFAIWLPVFLLLAAVSGMLAHSISEDNMFVDMLFTLGAFFTSLTVLFWARLRGISWKQLRTDIGWTSGVGLDKELVFGFAGYAMTIPILGVGILITMILMFLQQEVGGGNNPFSGTGGGAHPIIVEIANGGWSVRILLVVLAAVAAPIVEETMFRGVLYRHLRSLSHRMGLVASILISILVTSFLFAAIHPQGWVAIPALMGIAIGMNLLREWRGSLIPSMMVHGVSNGIVVSMMLIFLS